MCVRKSTKEAFIRWLAIILAGIAILSCLVFLSQDPVRRCDAMDKYLYNGLELPDLPEWDTTAYPYAYIYYVGENPAFCTLVLVPADAEIVFEEGTAAILFSTSHYRSYYARSVDEQWDDEGTTETSGSIYLFKPMVDYPTAYTVVQWTNFDVYTKDNKPLFPKSDPVLIRSGFNLKSWLTGFALGLTGKPLLLAKKPVAYLYGPEKHRLPALPYWDRTVYPYAFIAMRNGKYGFFVNDYPKIMDEKMGIVAASSNDYTCQLEDGQWMHKNIGGYNWIPIWSNYPIYYGSGGGGALFLEKSDPEPVYE